MNKLTEQTYLKIPEDQIQGKISLSKSKKVFIVTMKKSETEEVVGMVYRNSLERLAKLETPYIIIKKIIKQN